MADTLDGNSSKKRNKYWRFALLLIPLLCMFCYFSLPSDESYYKRLVRRSPHLTEIQLSNPALVTDGLADCTYDLSWPNEVTLQIRECETDALSTIDVNTGKIVHENSVIANDQETYVALFEPNGKDKLVATCPQKDLAIRGGSTQWGKYEISLWNQEQIIAAFPFTSEQWEDMEKAPHSYSGFSPNCRYFSLVLYGDIDVELYAQEELWLLDTQNNSFELVLTGERYPAWGDSPVQSVSPSWSPSEQEFVFGDSNFGLEIYNMMSGKRRFIAGPNWKTYDPKWSPSGKWIAAESFGEAEQDDTIIIIAPDRTEMALSLGCSLIGEFAWSPNGKQLAYTCSDFAESSGEELVSPCPEEEQLDCPCNGSDSLHETDSLWIWEIEK